MKNRLLRHPSPTHGNKRPADSVLEEAEREHSQVAAWLSRAEQCIADYPKLTLGIGLALGVTLGWIIKRR